MTMRYMSKKNLNWSVPEELADAFDEAISKRWHAKLKWLGASAAMLMYLSADEDERERWNLRAQELMRPESAREVVDKSLAEAESARQPRRAAARDKPQPKGRRRGEARE